jgi:hypothetical protein
LAAGAGVCIVSGAAHKRSGRRRRFGSGLGGRSVRGRRRRRRNRRWFPVDRIEQEAVLPHDRGAARPRQLDEQVHDRLVERLGRGDLDYGAAIRLALDHGAQRLDRRDRRDARGAVDLGRRHPRDERLALLALDRNDVDLGVQRLAGPRHDREPPEAGGRRGERHGEKRDEGKTGSMHHGSLHGIRPPDYFRLAPGTARDRG